MSFFDTTPGGRIVNRFGKDMDVIDSKIPTFIRVSLASVVPVLCTFAVVTYIIPIFALTFLPICVIFIIIKVSFPELYMA